jgi:septal ring factor EnvC (AmiA/AmiB activator)
VDKLVKQQRTELVKRDHQINQLREKAERAREKAEREREKAEREREKAERERIKRMKAEDKINASMQSCHEISMGAFGPGYKYTHTSGN